MPCHYPKRRLVVSVDISNKAFIHTKNVAHAQS